MGLWFAWLPMLLLLRFTAFADDWCPMNASQPAPENAYQVNDELRAGQPEKLYPPATYRSVQGVGYVLCTCETGKCIRKCCEPNAAYVNSRCTPLNASDHVAEFKVPKFVNANGTVDVYETGLFHIVYGKLTCSGKYKLDPTKDKSHNFQVNNAGFLLSESANVGPDQFCLEQFSELNYQILAVVCSPQQLAGQTEEKNVFNTIGMMLSLPFLFSTFLVYALIKDLQTLHGKSLMCHVATLLVAYTSLIVVQFITDNGDKTWCIFLAYTLQFTFLASFFWLNIMCFDLWWTFSGFRPLIGNTQENEANKFIIYSIYAWGCTTLISIITFGMDKLPYLIIDNIRPGFGISSCWFGSDLATLLYFYGPIGTLLFSNLLMFIHTAIVIVKHMSDAKVLRGSESQKNVDHYEKQRFMLYLKLFIVMGVNWLAEIISWVTSSGGSKFVWYVTDMGNSLQGVLIFLIFVCKKRVLNLLNKKLCPQIQIFKTSTKTTKTTNCTVPTKTSSNEKIKDAVEMSTESTSNLTNNQLHDL